MTNQHTPGPWTAHNGFVLEHGEVLASCIAGRGRTWEENQTNAALIAAAPEMLEALENAVGLLRTYGENVGCIEQCDAAIAKGRWMPS